MINKIFILAMLCLTISCGHNLPDFTSRLTTRLPIEGKPEAIGEYSLGCLKGAQTFEGHEIGLLFSQKKRGRYWGHPDLINLLARAGSEFNKTNKMIMIGDLSQSRGGPTMTGHSSHQNGLDVDVWFKIFSNKDQLTFRDLETEEMKPIKDLEDDQIKLIQYFVQDAAVERIFINPRFKKKLCLESGSLKLSADEQRKVRAWWGHDDHIHVRLKCPSDSPHCVSQKPIPPSDGCGDDLNWWFSEEAKAGDSDASWEDLKSIYLEKVRKLPEQCSFYRETF